MKRTLVAAVTVAALVIGSVGPAFAHELPIPPRQPSTTGTATDTPLALREIGHINPGPGATGDVYGFRKHAYLASWVGELCLSSGVRVYDLSDPRRPRQVSTFADRVSEPDLAGTWTEKVIVQRVDTRDFHGDLAVASVQPCGDDGFRGFALYDVTDPARPRPMGRYATPGAFGSHEIWLGAYGGRAYVYTAIIKSELLTGRGYDRTTHRAEAPGRADFRIVDVADPNRPRDVGEWGAWRELGIPPWQDGGQNYVHSVRVDAHLQRAYLSYWDLGTVILDISRPGRPRYLGRTHPPMGRTHSSTVTDGGRLLIETHETVGGVPFFYDISDPTRPRPLGQFTIPGSADTSVHDPKARAGIAYFSWYEQGVVAADITNPAQPRLLAQFIPDDPRPNPDCPADFACPFTWGVFLLGNLVLASDMTSGLYVLELGRR